MRKILILLMISLIPHLHAEWWGKLDVGPAYIHLDVLESGRTVTTLNQTGARAEATIKLYKGFVLRPCFLFGSGEGRLFTGSLGAGFCFPIKNKFFITPTIGYNYSYLHTTIDIPFLSLSNLRERFRSHAPYLSLDLCYNITNSLRIGSNVQYSWSRTYTHIHHITNSKDHAKGPSYGLYIEKDLNQNWSINIGGAYNISLSKEKHGLRAAGAKFAIVRWFD